MSIRFSISFGVCAVAAVLAGCGSVPSSDGDGPSTDPIAQRSLPVGTSCSSFVVACYDEFARQPANLACFRAVSRWNKTTLTWRLTNRVSGVGSADQIDAVRRALDAWAVVSGLTFVRTLDGASDITISFVENQHGDAFPFAASDESSNVLGHAFFPGSPQPGAVHLRDDEPWSLMPQPGEFDLYTVLVHELGHALGLEHSLAEGAVMGSSYTADGTAVLSEADIAAIQALYGGAMGDVPPLPARLPANFCDPGDLLAMGDPDSDGDGIPDTIEVFVLGTDPFNADSDGDGVMDFVEVFVDGTSPTTDPTAPDADGDGLPDEAETSVGSDPNNADTDGDTLTDGFEVLVLGTSPTNVDTDGDGLLDPDDPFPTNAMYGPVRPDCNENGVRDDEDIEANTSSDCNGNGVPDSCDVDSGASTDVNGNDVPDECDEAPCDDGDACTVDELVNGACENTPLECDDDLFCTGVETCEAGECVSEGPPCTSGQSCNETNDTCSTTSSPGPQPPAPDCDGDGTSDADELAGDSMDCNLNGIPDECDLSSGTSADLDENLVPDECDPLFVNASIELPGDGSTWGNAFNRLTDAIQAASDRLAKPEFSSLPGVEIWVAAGTYRPLSALPVDRAVSFELRNRVAIYGGFGGFEAFRAKRELDRNITILSGDNLGNDAQAAAAIVVEGFAPPDNAFHVVTATDTDATAILDGFYIVNGQADDASLDPPQVNGGGLLMQNSSALIANCTLANNLASESGGGAYVIGGAPTFLNTVFVNNSANGSGNGPDTGLGGGLATVDASSRLINGTFTLNFAQVGGGGIAVLGTTPPTIANCIVWDNSTEVAQIPVRDQIVVQPADTVITHCVIQDQTDLTGQNLALDPLFVDTQSCFGTPTPSSLRACMSGLSVSSGSPCIDSGIVDLLPLDASDADGNGDTSETYPLDRFGVLRRVDDPDTVDCLPLTGSCGPAPIVDIGAFEVQPLQR